MKILAILVFGVTLVLSAVDINTADKKELTTLNGIGDKKAEDIIAYRSKECFKSIENLVEVRGIGDKILEKNITNLTASKCSKK
jgi:competence protein ComEA